MIRIMTSDTSISRSQNKFPQLRKGTLKMRILSIETSANVASTAVTEDSTLIAEYTVNNKKTHSETLMPMIDTVLKNAQLDIGDIDLIAVSQGPGSFTGLRIGLSTAKGIAHAANIPLVGISTLKSIAYNMPYSEYIIAPVMDARRAQGYNALYEWKEGELVQIKAPRAISLEELLSELGSMDKKAVFAGDGVFVHRDTIIKGLGDRAVFAPSSALIQKASALADIAKKEFENGNAKNCYELTPVYLRKSQAEREFDERNDNKNDSNRQ